MVGYLERKKGKCGNGWTGNSNCGFEGGFGVIYARRDWGRLGKLWGRALGISSYRVNDWFNIVCRWEWLIWGGGLLGEMDDEDVMAPGIL
jgi:hypothetical protein